MLTAPRSDFGVQWPRTLAAAVALEAAFAVLARMGDLAQHVTGTIAAGLGAGILYVIGLYLLEHSLDSRRAFWIILIASVAFRLTLAPLRPSLSDDIFRYRFDGAVQAMGANPYLVRPDTPRFAAFRDTSIRQIPGHEIRSIYPPVAQLVYRVTWRLLPGPREFKLPFVLADLAVLGALAWRIRRHRLRNYQLAVYGWNPLVVVEFAASSHNDALALAATVGATLLIIGPRKLLSTCLLAAGVLAKAFPAVLVPVWLARLGWPRRGWGAVAAGCGFAGLCAWPYRSALPIVLATFRQYQTTYYGNNASLWTAIDWLTHSPRLATGVGVGVVGGLALWAAARKLDPARAAFLLFGAVLLLAPNTFPWYFTWVAPFLALVGTTRYLAPWLLLTISQFLSYQVLIGYQATGAWHFSPVFLWLTYGPFYVWLIWAAIKAPPSTGVELRTPSASLFP